MVGRRPGDAYGSVLLCVYPDIDMSRHSEDSCDEMFSDDALDQNRISDKEEDSERITGDMSLDTDADWTEILDNQPIVLNDRMMTDAMQSPHIQTEHSYSLTLNDEMPQSPSFGIAQNIKMEDYSKDMDTECFPGVSMSSGSSHSEFSDVEVFIKQEPPSPPPSSRAPSPPRCSNSSTISSLLGAPSSPMHPQSLLKQPTIVLATRPQSGSSIALSAREQQLLYPKVNVKVEPHLSTSGFPLPPTPPSCNGSDSDGSLSPVHTLRRHSPPPPPLLHRNSSSSSSSNSATNSSRKSQAKVLLSVTSAKHANSSQTSLISSQPKGATGVLLLTEEEKRTLLAEGYPIPQRLPLTKAEERSLKKIRRKIKNKISAQESRRKKKEYMDALEKKVEVLVNENNEYRKKLESLEGNNKSLMSQLQQLQAFLTDLPPKHCRNATTQTIQMASTSRYAETSRPRNQDISDDSNRKGR